MPHFGLYIHIPFCRAKCAYCDFYSLADRDDTDVRRLVLALLAEGKLCRQKLTIPDAVDSWYIGGGTPSRLGSNLLTELANGIAKLYPLADGGEATLEVNPEDVTPELLETAQELGFTRLSLGVQSMRPQILKKLGRRAGFLETVNALELIGRRWKADLSVDLIYGVDDRGKDGGLEGWLADIAEVLAYKPQHISAYELTLEKDSALTGFKADEETCRQMFLDGHRLLEGQSFQHYEISNYALAGHQCRHNHNYWLEGEYLGLGPSAVSYIAGERFGNPGNLDEYLALIKAGKPATTWREKLSAEKRAGEALVLALRMAEGVMIEEFSQAHSFDLSALIASDLVPYLERGLLSVKDGHLKLTLEGMLLSNEVFAAVV